jgi:HlyD family secretion protein
MSAVLALLLGLLLAAPIGGALAAPAAGGEPAPQTVSAFARLRPRDGVRVLTGPTTDFAFRIAQIDVHEGEMVEAGQPLAELDMKAERAASLALASAQVREAEVRVKFATRELDRRERLARASSPAISEERLDQARDAAETAAAQLETARRRKAYARILLEQATLRAPIAGMVLHILKREGEGISPDRGLIELGDVRHMEAVAEVFETNARFVKPGQAAEFRSPALAAPIAGRVLRVLPKVERARLYSTDAAENTEARVIDVIIALDDDPAVRRLTGLQGTAVIRVSSGA